MHQPLLMNFLKDILLLVGVDWLDGWVFPKQAKNLGEEPVVIGQVRSCAFGMHYPPKAFGKNGLSLYFSPTVVSLHPHSRQQADGSRALLQV